MTGTESVAFYRQAALAQSGEFALKSDDLDALLHQACRFVFSPLDTHLVKVVALKDDVASPSRSGWSTRLQPCL